VNKNNENSHYVNIVLEKLKLHLGVSSNIQLAKYLGMQPSTLSMQQKRGRLDLFRIIQACSGVDWNWVLDGDIASTNDLNPGYSSIDTKDLPEYVKSYIHQKENDFRRVNAENNELQKTIGQLQMELETTREKLSLLKEVIASGKNQ
jgi:hypothetical protein